LRKYAEEYDIPLTTLYSRFKSGESMEEALDKNKTRDWGGPRIVNWWHPRYVDPDWEDEDVEEREVKKGTWGGYHHGKRKKTLGDVESEASAPGASPPCSNGAEERVKNEEKSTRS
jgi:hypothetical protein